MMFRRDIFKYCRFVAAVVMACGTASVFAEKIRFSKPAVPIAMPPKVEEELPEGPGERLDFAAPNVERPMAPRMPLVRVQRQKERDSEENVHWLMRDLPDAFGRPNAQSPLAREKALSGWGN